MSLYGIDFLQDRDGKFWIAEINGANSGMKGFRQVYGDDRVREQVYREISGEKKLTIDTGRYALLQYTKKRPVRAHIHRATAHLPWFIRKRMSPGFFRSPKAFTKWLEETLPGVEKKTDIQVEFPGVEEYVGQDSIVINARGHPVAHPTVNTDLAQKITKNKFLQYRLLRGLTIGDHFPYTTLAGLGWVHPEEIDELVTRGDTFIQKPIIGQCGLGVHKIDKNQLLQLKNEEGNIQTRTNEFDSYIPSIAKMIGLLSVEPETLEDLVHQGQYEFEYCVSIIQECVDTRRIINGSEQHTSIRAIVCNGKFVDAYLRASPQFRANLSQGASAHAFDHPELPALSEEVVRVFEKQLENPYPDGITPDCWDLMYRPGLYLRYFQTHPDRKTQQSPTFVMALNLFDIINKAKA